MGDQDLIIEQHMRGGVGDFSITCAGQRIIIIHRYHQSIR